MNETLSSTGNARLLSIIFPRLKEAGAENILNAYSSLHHFYRSCVGESAGRQYALTERQKITLSAMHELISRAHYESLKGEIIGSPNIAKEWLQHKLRVYEHEVFACMFLDSQQRILGFEKLFYGMIDSAEVHPREVVKRALHYNAASVIFTHNHPSRLCEPSHADENITKKPISSLELIDVRVLDHFVVGEKVTSFAERGLL